MAKCRGKHYRVAQRETEKLKNKNIVFQQEITNKISTVMMAFVVISFIKLILLLYSFRDQNSI